MAVSENQFIRQVDALIDERLMLMPAIDLDTVSHNLLSTSCRHLCISKTAKRSRPLLCLYYYWMFSDNVDDNLAKIATAAEFIHAASLLHDDIVDEADKRRGRASVNRAFGNATAVLAGDFLLTEAFDLLKPFHRDLSNRAISVIRQMTKAAILELNTRGNIDVNKETWYAIAKGKTGVLFSWCGYAVALHVEQQEMTARLWEVGERVGLIFQLVDDLKDFHGDMNLKDICRDLRNLEPSMPMILAMDLDPNVKKRIDQSFRAGQIDDQEAIILRELIIKSGAIVQVKDLIAEELSKIIELLAVFKKTLGKAYLDRFIDQLATLPFMSQVNRGSP